jgi:hypothetical protein
LAVSTNKKVTVVRFDREALHGFVQMANYLAPEGVELLSPAGTVASIPYGDIKCVCFVKDWDKAENLLEKRTFASRPKQEGLWVKAIWRDGDSIEALLANRLLDLDASGYPVVPPDPGANAQRLFLPKAALSELVVLGVVGAGRKPAAARPAKSGPAQQLKMFD